MRKTARENAFKLTFEQLIGGARNELTYNALTSGLNEEDKLYLDTLLDGVTSEKAFFDKNDSELRSRLYGGTYLQNRFGDTSYCDV